MQVNFPAWAKLMRIATRNCHRKTAAYPVNHIPCYNRINRKSPLGIELLKVRLVSEFVNAKIYFKSFLFPPIAFSGICFYNISTTLH